MNYDKSERSGKPAAGGSFEERYARARELPEELSSAGAEYVKRGKVKCQSVDSRAAGLVELTGAVQCPFGVVRRPTLSVVRRGGRMLVERFHCGCREGTRDQFCAHCAAVLAERFESAEVRLPGEAPNQNEMDLKGIRIRLGTQRKTQDPVFWFPEDPEQVSTPNLAVIGGADTGNTQVMKSIALQFLRQRREQPEETGLLVLDWMGDYDESKTDFLEATGARVRKLQKLPMNPFSLRGMERKPQLHVHRAMSFADTLARAYGLSPLQKSTLVQSVMAAYTAKGITSDPVTWDRSAPTFADVYEEYCSRPQTQRSDALNPVMESLTAFELFDSNLPDLEGFQEIFRGVVVIDMSGYPRELQRFAAGIMLEQFHALLCGSRRRRSGRVSKMLMIDEADPLLEMGSPGLEGLLRRSREYGLAVMLAVRSPVCFCESSVDWWQVIRTWIIHNAEELYRPELESLLQLDTLEAGAERLYQVVKRQQKLQSLIRISTEEPVPVEDLPFYEIVGDQNQNYLRERSQEIRPQLLEGMPLLDMAHLEDLAEMEEIVPGPMEIL